MKVVKYNKNIIIYIYDKKYKDKKIEDLIKYIFELLKNNYNYEIKSSYNLRLYINKYYGMILEIKEGKDNCYNIVNINLKILKDILILYQVNDPLDYINNEIYYYDNKFYINLKYEDISIFENSNLIYGKDAYKIIGSGIKL